MPFASQTWSIYDLEQNPDGPNNVYTTGTFLSHLISWFTTNNTQWTISDTNNTDYIELQPPAGAINTDDRLLLFMNAVPAVAAMADSASGRFAEYVYQCYAPGAGTTGPDNNPTAGDPYTGVNSTKLQVSRGVFSGSNQQALRVCMSNDGIFIHTRRNSGTPGLDDYQGLCLAGRLFNPVETTDQLPLSYGMGTASGNLWSEQFQESGYLPTAPGALDTDDCICYVQTTDADVPFEMCERSNSWRHNGFSGPGNRNYYQDIELNARTSSTNGGDHLGALRAVYAGNAENNGTIITDVTGNRGIAISLNDSEAVNSTFYLWNE